MPPSNGGALTTTMTGCWAVLLLFTVPSVLAATAWKETVEMDCAAIADNSTTRLQGIAFTTYRLVDCVKSAASVVTIILPVVNETILGRTILGSIIVHVQGGNVLPRLVLPPPSTSARKNNDNNEKHAEDILVVLDGVEFVAALGGSTSWVHVTKDFDQSGGGGLLLALAQVGSWHNISLTVSHTQIRIVGPGALFDTTRTASSRAIAALAYMSSSEKVDKNRTTTFAVSSHFSILVSESVINVTEVIGVAALFIVEHSEIVEWLSVQITDRSVVALHVMSTIAACSDKVSKAPLSHQALFLVRGSSDDDSQLRHFVFNVSKTSRAALFFNPFKGCREKAAQTEAGAFSVRGQGTVQRGVFSIATSFISVLFAPRVVSDDVTSTGNYSSRAFVFGVSEVRKAENVSILVAAGGGSTCETNATDFSAVFFFFNIDLVEACEVRCSALSSTTMVTFSTLLTARLASVIALEQVAVAHKCLIWVTNTSANVSSLPGNGTLSLAAAAAIIFVKGALRNSTLHIEQSQLVGRASGGITSTNAFLVNVAACVLFPREMSVQVAVGLAVRMDRVDVFATMGITHIGVEGFSMIVASAAVVASAMPLNDTSLDIQHSNIVALGAQLLGGMLVVKRSVIGIVVCSFGASTSILGVMPGVLEVLTNVPYHHVRLSMFNVTTRTAGDFLIPNSPSERHFAGACLMTLPTSISDDSVVHIANSKCDSSSQVGEMFQSSAICSLGNVMVRSTQVDVSSTAIAHLVVSVDGELRFQEDVDVMFGQIVAASTVNGVAPIATLVTPTLLPLGQTSKITFSASSCMCIANSRFAGFAKLADRGVYLSALPPVPHTTRCCHSGAPPSRLLLACVMWGHEELTLASLTRDELLPGESGGAGGVANVLLCASSTTASLTLPQQDLANFDVAGNEGASAVGGFAAAAASVSIAVASVAGGAAIADLQVFALMGQSPCAPRALQSSTSASAYVLVSPFYGLGSEAQVVGGVGLVAGAALLQLGMRFVVQRYLGGYQQQTTLSPSELDSRKGRRYSRVPSPHVSVGARVVRALGMFPRLCYFIGCLLVPGVWSSTLRILSSGGGDAGSKRIWGSDAGGVVIGSFGALCVLGSCVWRLREGRRVDEASSGVSLTFRRHRVRTLRSTTCVPSSALPIGYWGPADHRASHGQLRNIVRGGVGFMSAYPVVVTLAVATASSLPFYDHGRCTVVWGVLSVVHFGSAAIVLKVRPGRVPLSDVVFVVLMGFALSIDVASAVRSSQPDDSIIVDQVLLWLSAASTLSACCRSAHAALVLLWERRFYASKELAEDDARASRCHPLEEQRTLDEQRSNEHRAREALRAAAAVTSVNSLPSASSASLFSAMRQRCSVRKTTSEEQLLSVIQLICNRETKSRVAQRK